MVSMTHSISLVIATKDRPNDLRTLFQSLCRQTIPPAEVVVVDASAQPVESVVSEFPNLHVRYVRHLTPSAAAQRNAGILACSSNTTLIGFADDDTTFEPRSFENMLAFWEGATSEVLGAAFNILNYPERRSTILKRSKLAERLGLYSSRPGRVALSGWQSVIGQVAETQFVDWLPSTAVTFRREALTEHLFDHLFESYSYLEDLDLSYTIGRSGRLAVVATAGFCHFPSESGRVSAQQFGRYEVRNRIYFVRKHGLSLSRCYLGLCIRTMMTLFNGLAGLNKALLARARGNLAELASF